MHLSIADNEETVRSAFTGPLTTLFRSHTYRTIRTTRYLRSQFLAKYATLGGPMFQIQTSFDLFAVRLSIWICNLFVRVSNSLPVLRFATASVSSTGDTNTPDSALEGPDIEDGTKKQAPRAVNRSCRGGTVRRIRPTLALTGIWSPIKIHQDIKWCFDGTTRWVEHKPAKVTGRRRYVTNIGLIDDFSPLEGGTFLEATNGTWQYVPPGQQPRVIYPALYTYVYATGAAIVCATQDCHSQGCRPDFDLNTHCYYI
jgi:hypothetical protein